MKRLIKFVYKICMEYCMFVIGTGCVFGIIALYGVTSVPVPAQSLITIRQNITFEEYEKIMEIILASCAALYTILKGGYIIITSKIPFPESILSCLYPGVFLILFGGLHLWKQLFPIAICAIPLMFICWMLEKVFIIINDKSK